MAKPNLATRKNITVIDFAPGVVDAAKAHVAGHHLRVNPKSPAPATIKGPTLVRFDTRNVGGGIGPRRQVA